jgi:hypothetical protein
MGTTAFGGCAVSVWQCVSFNCKSSSPSMT